MSRSQTSLFSHKKVIKLIQVNLFLNVCQAILYTYSQSHGLSLVNVSYVLVTVKCESISLLNFLKIGTFACSEITYLFYLICTNTHL